jgi:hypothetical protein
MLKTKKRCSNLFRILLKVGEEQNPRKKTLKPKKKKKTKKRKKTTNFEVWGLELICQQTDNQKTKTRTLWVMG